MKDNYFTLEKEIKCLKDIKAYKNWSMCQDSNCVSTTKVEII